MAAQEGNKFWEQRSKHGRDKLFASPELLWEAACEYFTWCDDNPLFKTEIIAYMGQVEHVQVPLKRVYTLQGLCLYLDCGHAYFRQFKMESKNRDDRQDFLTAIAKVEEVIYRQKFEGAAAGLFKEGLITRDLGLADKQQLSTPEGESFNLTLNL